MGFVRPRAIARRVSSSAGAFLKGVTFVPGRSGSRMFGAGLAALMLAGGSAHITVDRLTALPDDAAIRIGEQVVTRQELNRRVELLTALYGVQRPDDPAKQDRFTRDSAKATVLAEILSSAAKERGIHISDKEASDQLAKIVEKNYPQGRKGFIDKLGQMGLSEDEVLAELKRQRINKQLFDQITENVRPVNDEELRKAFDDRKAEMVTPERRHLRNIVVDSEEKAKQVLQRARSGEDFGELAKEVSLDASTKQKGGDLGTVMADQMEKAYADAAFSAKSGAVFGPVQTKHGWNVGKVLEITPEKPLKFEDIKEEFRRQVTLERKLQVWSDWLAGRVEAADVEYADDYRPANPESPPSLVP